MKPQSVTIQFKANWAVCFYDIFQITFLISYLLTSFLDDNLPTSLSDCPPDLTLASHRSISDILWEIREGDNLRLLSRPTLPTIFPANSGTSFVKLLAVAFNLHLADVRSYPCQIGRLIAWHVVILPRRLKELWRLRDTSSWSSIYYKLMK